MGLTDPGAAFQPQFGTQSALPGAEVRGGDAIRCGGFSGADDGLGRAQAVVADDGRRVGVKYIGDVDIEVWFDEVGAGTGGLERGVKAADGGVVE
eukprot:CAMPEP_0174903320 /NCGR_PEP_ID=MMETSP0167-20121228/43281_1 /TAXON_ID=38298 /ORGANISM="Rhodella maculata, Strain CCMP736" /LENGTH=94 /DNA_ID=CAMNT_0016145619 /DNA_START=134 /DNA_END=416 /DNA_ORIENTATION=+